MLKNITIIFNVLSDNSIYTEGCDYLGESLKSLTKLTSLQIDL
jgi:hypothetical protein